MFVGLYMLSLFVFIYFNSRKEIFSSPSSKPEPVSIVMPCYNDGEHIGEAIESLLHMDYPKELIEIIVVDDCSKDNSAQIVRRYCEKYSNVRLFSTSKNSGGAAEPTNLGIMNAKYNYIAVADADSTPEKNALSKMIGFLQKDSSVAGVTCPVLAKKPENFIQRLQAIEYAIIAFNRKLLDMVDSVYVTPGPFAVYRKKDLISVGLFDKKNMTQDIEIVWRLLSNGFKARMCLDTAVYSATPERFGQWWRQRVRWNIGGTQTLIKYRKYVFRKGMLGLFIIPFFAFSLTLGLIGLLLFSYLFVKRSIISYLSIHYASYANTAFLRFQDLTFQPTILNYLGIMMFVLGVSFSFFALFIMKDKMIGSRNIFNVLFYSLVYLMIYPFIMITGLTKLITGRYSW